jgi:hypothetical protein
MNEPDNTNGVRVCCNPALPASVAGFRRLSSCAEGWALSHLVGASDAKVAKASRSLSLSPGRDYARNLTSAGCACKEAAEVFSI